MCNKSEIRVASEWTVYAIATAVAAVWSIILTVWFGEFIFASMPHLIEWIWQ